MISDADHRSPTGRLRYAILRHDAPYVHLDLLLEVGTALETWRLEDDGSQLFAARGPLTLTAASLAPHRPDYLTYEGPVSGGRGQVMRLDDGTYQPHLQSADLWKLTIQGRRLRGELVLTREEGPLWRCDYLPQSPRD